MGVALGVDTQAENRHGVSHVPSEGSLRARVPDHHPRRRTLGKRTVAAIALDAGPEQGAAIEETWAVGNGLYLQGRIAGSKVSFLFNTGSRVLILAARIWREWDRPRDELAKYWGRLCSVEGWSLECLGWTRLAVTLGTRVIEWDFIVAEIGEDEGILSNDFAMATRECHVSPRFLFSRQGGYGGAPTMCRSVCRRG